ncbi:hypothetical protein D3C78_1166310 [compost metagenome]
MEKTFLFGVTPPRRIAEAWATAVTTTGAPIESVRVRVNAGRLNVLNMPCRRPMKAVRIRSSSRDSAENVSWHCQYAPG